MYHATKDQIAPSPRRRDQRPATTISGHPPSPQGMAPSHPRRFERIRQQGDQ